MQTELSYVSNIEKIFENIYSVNGSSTIQLYYGLRRLMPKSADPSINELLRSSPIPPTNADLLVRSARFVDRYVGTSASTDRAHKVEGQEIPPHIDMAQWVIGEKRSTFDKRRLDSKGRDI